MSTNINRRTAFLMISAALGISVLPEVALADAKSEAYIQGIGNQVLTLANGSLRGKPLRAKFATLLGQHVNLRGITTASLGTYQKQLPAGDKDKLNQLVTTYSAALFAWYADDFKGKEFIVDRVAKQGNFTVVHSKIDKAGVRPDEPIVWYLSNGRIVDLSVLGVRLSSAMRERFSRELKKSKGDFEALYAMLREAETW
jgi:phospholipid transport system substrate-binding protein